MGSSEMSVTALLESPLLIFAVLHLAGLVLTYRIRRSLKSRDAPLGYFLLLLGICFGVAARAIPHGVPVDSTATVVAMLASMVATGLSLAGTLLLLRALLKHPAGRENAPQ